MTSPIPTHSSLPSLAPSGSTAFQFLNATPVNHHPFTDAQVEEYREQDRWLPIANVARIMKNSLPSNAKISKEAKECVQECVSEFISFITSEAADKCSTEKRKTINGEDILTSMRSLGFDNYESVIKIYLAKYREVSCFAELTSALAEVNKHQLASTKRSGGAGDGEEDEQEGGSKRKKQRNMGSTPTKRKTTTQTSIESGLT